VGGLEPNSLIEVYAYADELWTIGGNPHQTVKFESGAFTFAIL